MSEADTHHRLDGLEPDNLLAFLALLGLLRSLEAVDRTQAEGSKLRPRAFWDTEISPLRPVLRLSSPLDPLKIAEIADRGISILNSAYEFAGRMDLNYSRTDARRCLETAVQAASRKDRNRTDLLAALMSDAAIKENKNADAAPIDPTPLCLLFGQGHQHFLERMASVPLQTAPPPRGKGKTAKTISAAECLFEALFVPWHRNDATFSFRWDPEEGVRYALMAGDPTDNAYKGGTQHGANRFAAIGLALLTVAPDTRARRVRPSVLGGAFGPDGFSFRWPVWKDPATLASIMGLLGHPDLPKSHALTHLGVVYVFAARRISVGKFMNFARATVEI